MMKEYESDEGRWDYTEGDKPESQTTDYDPEELERARIRMKAEKKRIEDPEIGVFDWELEKSGEPFQKGQAMDISHKKCPHCNFETSFKPDDLWQETDADTELDTHIRNKHGINESTSTESVTSWWGSASPKNLEFRSKALDKINANTDLQDKEFWELPEDIQDNIYELYTSGYSNEATEERINTDTYHYDYSDYWKKGDSYVRAGLAMGSGLSTDTANKEWDELTKEEQIKILESGYVTSHELMGEQPKEEEKKIHQQLEKEFGDEESTVSVSGPPAGTQPPANIWDDLDKAEEDFVEQEHPREQTGKFTTKGGGSSKAGQPKEKSKKEFTLKDYERNEGRNAHTLNALNLVKKYGTPEEIKEMEEIKDRHDKSEHGINHDDYKRRYDISQKYYDKLVEDETGEKPFWAKDEPKTEKPKEEKRFTLKQYERNEDVNNHGKNAQLLVKQYGTPEELEEINAILKRNPNGYSGVDGHADYQRRHEISNKYYDKLVEDETKSNESNANEFEPERQGRKVKINKGTYAGQTGRVGAIPLIDDSSFFVRVDGVHNEYEDGIQVNVNDVTFLGGEVKYDLYEKVEEVKIPNQDIELHKYVWESMYGYGSATGRMSPVEDWNQGGSFEHPYSEIFREFRGLKWSELPKDIQDAWKAERDYAPYDSESHVKSDIKGWLDKTFPTEYEEPQKGLDSETKADEDWYDTDDSNYKPEVLKYKIVTSLGNDWGLQTNSKAEAQRAVDEWNNDYEKSVSGSLPYTLKIVDNESVDDPKDIKLLDRLLDNELEEEKEGEDEEEDIAILLQLLAPDEKANEVDPNCPECGGDGYIDVPSRWSSDGLRQEPCPRCGGEDDYHDTYDESYKKKATELDSIYKQFTGQINAPTGKGIMDSVRGYSEPEADGQDLTGTTANEEIIEKTPPKINYQYYKQYPFGRIQKGFFGEVDRKWWETASYEEKAKELSDIGFGMGADIGEKGNPLARRSWDDLPNEARQQWGYFGNEVELSTMYQARDWWDKKYPDRLWKDMHIDGRQRAIMAFLRDPDTELKSEEGGQGSGRKPYASKDPARKDRAHVGWKNQGIDKYTDLAMKDYLTGKKSTPEEYEYAGYHASKEVEDQKCEGCGREEDYLNDDNLCEDCEREAGIDREESKRDAYEGGKGSGKKGHQQWMRSLEEDPSYGECKNCKVITEKVNNKCQMCGRKY